MGLHGTVDVPGSGGGVIGAAGKDGYILAEVHDGVVDVEGLLYIVGRNAGGVHHLHAHFVVAGTGEDTGERVTGKTVGEFTGLGVGKEPYRDDTLGIYGEGNLIELLVYLNHRLIGSG